MSPHFLLIMMHSQISNSANLTSSCTLSYQQLVCAIMVLLVILFERFGRVLHLLGIFEHISTASDESAATKF